MGRKSLWQKKILNRWHYQMYVIGYLDIFITTASALKKIEKKKYFTEIRKAVHIALNNIYIATNTSTKNDLLLFTMNNYYTTSELSRLAYELFVNKTLNKEKLNILLEQLRKFNRKSNIIINQFIRERGFNLRKFV
jgi:ABC-type Fe3+-citrate transport system substrate-binding protein